jgi:hypothetical protein
MSRLRVLRCSVAVVGFMVAAAAFGAPPAAPRVTPVKPTTKATADLICKSRLRPGSHIATRRCLTAAQWAAPNPFVWGATHADAGMGPWGQVSTAGQSAGASAFTAR